MVYAALTESMSCINDVWAWTFTNLQLNKAKTELLWSATSNVFASFCSYCYESVQTNCAFNLDIFIDANLSLKTHVPRTVFAYFAVLQQLRSSSRSLS